MNGLVRSELIQIFVRKTRDVLQDFVGVFAEKRCADRFDFGPIHLPGRADQFEVSELRVVDLDKGSAILQMRVGIEIS